eukprot:scaffold38093_cov56-Phaeocystis_antarctica.AAC.1
MGVAAAVAALQAHVAVARVAEAACSRLANVCIEEGNRQLAAAAGALEAAVGAMQAHPQVVGVQEHGCGVLRNICCGEDAAGLA